MKKMRTIATTLGCIALAVAIPAFAQMHEGMGGPGKGMMMEGMEHRGPGMMPGMGGMMMMADDHALWKHVWDLGLDEKQNAAVKAIRSKATKDMVRKKADQQVLHIELKDLLDKEPVDMKAIEALVKKCESLRTDMFLTHIRTQEEVKAQLTAEQRKKLKELMAGHRCGKECAMHGEGHGKH